MARVCLAFIAGSRLLPTGNTGRGVTKRAPPSDKETLFPIFCLHLGGRGNEERICLLLFLRHPFYYLPTFIFLVLFPSLDVTQSRGHQAGSAPALPYNGTRFHFYREKTPALSPLVDSHRIAPTHTARQYTYVNPFCVLKSLFCGRGKLLEHK